MSEHYKNYFDKIIQSDNCKILISPLQISEIFNRWLRFHAFKQYEKDHRPAEFKEYYKSNYRKSGNFINKYMLIKEELENYSDKFEIKELQEVNYDLMTNFAPDQLDFNDNYIYLFAKQHNATLITDDGDYRNLDFKVATYNRKLYNAYKDSIKPTLNKK